VKQRLKLAVVSPKLIALFRKGEMTLDQLWRSPCPTTTKSRKRFGGTAGLGEAGGRAAKSAPRSPRTCRRRQQAGEVRRAETYEKFGGTVLTDLFAEEGTGWLTDQACSTVWSQRRWSSLPVQFEPRGGSG